MAGTTVPVFMSQLIITIITRIENFKEATLRHAVELDKVALHMRTFNNVADASVMKMLTCCLKLLSDRHKNNICSRLDRCITTFQPEATVAPRCRGQRDTGC